MLTPGVVVSLMAMTDEPIRQPQPGVEEMSESERERWRRYAAEELPRLERELDEVQENLARIARGEPRIRRGARRASR